MDYYKKIPKHLRRDYNRHIRKRIYYTIKAVVLFPLLYHRKHRLFAMGEIKDNLHLKNSNWYWLVDNTEHLDGNPENPLNFVSCWYGDKPYRQSKNFDYKTASGVKRYLASMRWVLGRNSIYNWKRKEGFAYRGKMVNGSLNVIHFEGDRSPLVFRNKNIRGISAITYLVDLDAGGQKELFRYSHTIKKGKYWVNKMRGAGALGYLYKNKRFK